MVDSHVNAIQELPHPSSTHTVAALDRPAGRLHQQEDMDTGDTLAQRVAPMVMAALVDLHTGVRHPTRGTLALVQ